MLNMFDRVALWVSDQATFGMMTVCGCGTWLYSVWHTDAYCVNECRRCGATWTEDECPF